MDIIKSNPEYYIDSNGKLSVLDLSIGTQITDLSWQWEFRLGENYSNYSFLEEEELKSKLDYVTWVVVAKNHYSDMEPHVTLVTNEAIGRFTFDNSTNRGHEDEECGHNNWRQSGADNATLGLRPWLNSNGIHKSEGFLNAFSETFKKVLVKTILPNCNWENGEKYITEDFVFVPSTTEICDFNNYNRIQTYKIGSPYPYYFDDNGNYDALKCCKECSYWTRSPYLDSGRFVQVIRTFTSHWEGELVGGTSASNSICVCPAVNIKADTKICKL